MSVFDAVFRYRQSDDPGAVGPGCYWVDTTSEPYMLYLRNETDTDWIQIGASAGTPYTDEMARDALGAALTAGTGITVTPNDGSDIITVATTITQYTDEMSRDALATALVAGNNIDITVNDGADTITIDVESLTSADITDFATAVDERARDAVGTALTAGAGITVTPNDGADTITIASTITQYTDEMSRDALGTALVAGNNIDITVNDGADTITIDVETLTNADISDWTEAVQDTVGAFLSGDGGVMTVSYNDAGNAFSILHSGNHDSRYYTEAEVDNLIADILENPSFTDHLDTDGGTMSFTALTAAGTTAVVSSSTGKNSSGMIELVPGGTGIASGSLVECTFASARPDANYQVIFTPLSSAAVTLGGVSVTSRSTTVFRLRTASAPTTALTYQWFYFVIGY